MSTKKVVSLGTPTDDADAANKKYVDDAEERLDNTKVDRAGDTMSDNLSLVDGTGDPVVITSPAHVTTKKYVDEAIADSVSSPITYHGVIDATKTGPTSNPPKSGDLYIHDTQGNYSPGEIEILWGFPFGTEIEDLDRL